MVSCVREAVVEASSCRRLEARRSTGWRSLGVTSSECGGRPLTRGRRGGSRRSSAQGKFRLEARRSTGWRSLGVTSSACGGRPAGLSRDQGEGDRGDQALKGEEQAGGRRADKGGGWSGGGAGKQEPSAERGCRPLKISSVLAGHIQPPPCPSPATGDLRLLRPVERDHEEPKTHRPRAPGPLTVESHIQGSPVIAVR